MLVTASPSPSDNVRGEGMCGNRYKHDGCVCPCPTGIISIWERLANPTPRVVCVLTVLG